MKAKPPRYVLDSFALLAFLQNQAGGAPVRQILDQAARRQAEVFLCLINLGEAVYVAEREQGLPAAQSLLAAVDQLPITLVTADRGLTLAAAHIKAQFPLAYADAFAAALAEQQQAALLTGDPEFRHVEHLISVSWLPSH